MGHLSRHRRTVTIAPLERLPTISFDSVQLGAADPAGAARAYALLIGREPVRLHSGAYRFQLDRGALEIESGEPGLRSLGFTAGDPSADLAGFDFHGLRLRLTPVIGGGGAHDSSVAERSSEVADVRVAGDQLAALDHVVVRSTDLDRAIGLWRDRLGVRLALDREFPARGLRMLFFRSSGVTLEFVGALGAPDPAGIDALDGLAYEVGDLAACRARLVEAGLDVSPLRDGNKRGTRVATVRSGTEGVPTLLIEHLDRKDIR